MPEDVVCGPDHIPIAQRYSAGRPGPVGAVAPVATGPVAAGPVVGSPLVGSLLVGSPLVGSLLAGSVGVAGVALSVGSAALIRSAKVPAVGCPAAGGHAGALLIALWLLLPVLVGSALLIGPAEAQASAQKEICNIQQSALVACPKGSGDAFEVGGSRRGNRWIDNSV